MAFEQATSTTSMNTPTNQEGLVVTEVTPIKALMDTISGGTCGGGGDTWKSTDVKGRMVKMSQKAWNYVQKIMEDHQKTLVDLEALKANCLQLQREQTVFKTALEQAIAERDMLRGEVLKVEKEHSQYVEKTIAETASMKQSLEKMGEEKDALEETLETLKSSMTILGNTQARLVIEREIISKQLGDVKEERDQLQEAVEDLGNSIQSLAIKSNLHKNKAKN
jgi:chromosome segregation ATPase